MGPNRILRQRICVKHDLMKHHLNDITMSYQSIHFTESLGSNLLTALIPYTLLHYSKIVKEYKLIVRTPTQMEQIQSLKSS